MTAWIRMADAYARRMKYVAPAALVAGWIIAQSIPKPMPDSSGVPLWKIVAGMAAWLVSVTWVVALVTSTERSLHLRAEEVDFSGWERGPAWRLGATTGIFLWARQSGTLERRTGTWRGRVGGIGELSQIYPWNNSRIRIAWIRLPQRLPALEVFRPTRGHSGRWGRVLGSADEDFEAQFHVECKDLAYAHSILGTQARARILTEARQFSTLAIDGDLAYVVVGSGRRWRRNQAARTLELLSDVVDLVPQKTWRARGSSPDDWEPTPPEPSRPEPPQQEPARRVDPALAVLPGIQFSRRKNALAWVGLVLSATFVGALVGVFFGHAALRACERGEATNHVTAVAATTLGYGALGVFCFVLGLATFLV